MRGFLGGNNHCSHQQADRQPQRGNPGICAHNRRTPCGHSLYLLEGGATGVGGGEREREREREGGMETESKYNLPKSYAIIYSGKTCSHPPAEHPQRMTMINRNVSLINVVIYRPLCAVKCTVIHYSVYESRHTAAVVRDHLSWHTPGKQLKSSQGQTDIIILTAFE